MGGWLFGAKCSWLGIPTAQIVGSLPGDGPIPPHKECAASVLARWDDEDAYIVKKASKSTKTMSRFPINRFFVDHAFFVSDSNDPVAFLLSLTCYLYFTPHAYLYFVLLRVCFNARLIMEVDVHMRIRVWVLESIKSFGKGQK